MLYCTVISYCFLDVDMKKQLSNAKNSSLSFSCLIFQNCITLHIVAGAGTPVKTKLSQPNNKNVSSVSGGNFLSMSLRYFTTKCEIFCTIFFQISFERGVCLIKSV